nr:putative reverse transcriptase domain-containing protein [Tanacetum cinerariifolium]
SLLYTGNFMLPKPDLILVDMDEYVVSKSITGVSAVATNEAKTTRARVRQKGYADVRRKPMEFEVGDMVMLKASPWKGIIRFGKRGKLSPRYIGLFEIIERIGPVAYKLELPE